ncbi:MAG: peptidylprolyl isomerase [Patescibacteria group bacterium]
MGRKSRTKQINKIQASVDKSAKGKKTRTWVLIILGIVLVAGAGIGATVYKNKHAKKSDAQVIDHAKEPENDKVAVIETDKGSIYVQLYRSAAPFTVSNFEKLVGENFYTGTTFHRVISDFMIQGGDPNTKDTDPSNDGSGGTGQYFPDEINPKSLGLTDEAITALKAQGYQYDETRQSVKNTIGAISMANSGPNTNSSQFFIITTKDQPQLDGKHTVFGHVLKGLDIAQKITQGDVIKKISLMGISDFNKQFNPLGITTSGGGGVTVEQIPVDQVNPATPNTAIPAPTIKIDTKKK